LNVWLDEIETARISLAPNRASRVQTKRSSRCGKKFFVFIFLCIIIISLDGTKIIQFLINRLAFPIKITKKAVFFGFIGIRVVLKGL